VGLTDGNAAQAKKRRNPEGELLVGWSGRRCSPPRSPMKGMRVTRALPYRAHQKARAMHPLLP